MDLYLFKHEGIDYKLDHAKLKKWKMDFTEIIALIELVQFQHHMSIPHPTEPTFGFVSYETYMEHSFWTSRYSVIRTFDKLESRGLLRKKVAQSIKDGKHNMHCFFELTRRVDDLAETPVINIIREVIAKRCADSNHKSVYFNVTPAIVANKRNGVRNRTAIRCAKPHDKDQDIYIRKEKTEDKKSNASRRSLEVAATLKDEEKIQDKIASRVMNEEACGEDSLTSQDTFPNRTELSYGPPWEEPVTLYDAPRIDADPSNLPQVESETVTPPPTCSDYALPRNLKDELRKNIQILASAQLSDIEYQSALNFCISVGFGDAPKTVRRMGRVLRVIPREIMAPSIKLYTLARSYTKNDPSDRFYFKYVAELGDWSEEFQ